jgi:hypothetical protein
MVWSAVLMSFYQAAFTVEPLTAEAMALPRKLNTN